jgi:hypothetical protein
MIEQNIENAHERDKYRCHVRDIQSKCGKKVALCHPMDSHERKDPISFVRFQEAHHTGQGDRRAG